MQIFSVYYTHKPGGFCKRLYALLNALSSSGHEVEYFCLDRPPHVLSNSVIWRKVPFPLSRREGLLFWIVFCLWLPVYLLVVNKGKNGRWLVFSPFYVCLLIFLRLLSNFSVICFVRSKLEPNYSYFLANSADKILSRICFKISDKVIFQTSSNLELACSMSCLRHKTEILPNNVRSIDFVAREADLPLSVVTCAVFKEKKNLELLLDAWSSLEVELAELCPRLIIIGKIETGVQNDRLSQKQNCVSFLGWLDKPEDEFCKYDIYIHPSLHEGMPNAALEAMGKGLLVLVSNTAELIELVGYKDLTFDSISSLELVRKMVYLTHNRDQLCRLRSLSNKRAIELCFDWDRYAQNIALN